MKRLLLALLGTAILGACSSQNRTLPVLPANNFSAPVQQLNVRSDQGLYDGVVELRKVRFKKWDTNFDGLLKRNEVKDENMKIPGIINGFSDYDTNNNGEITLKEFLREDVIEFWMNLIRPKLEELFAKHDQDGNWLLTTDSEKAKLKLFFSPWPNLKSGDLNEDGVITFSEFEDAYMKVLPFFQQEKESTRLPAIK